MVLNLMESYHTEDSLEYYLHGTTFVRGFRTLFILNRQRIQKLANKCILHGESSNKVSWKFDIKPDDFLKCIKPVKAGTMIYEARGRPEQQVGASIIYIVASAEADFSWSSFFSQNIDRLWVKGVASASWLMKFFDEIDLSDIIRTRRYVWY